MQTTKSLNRQIAFSFFAFAAVLTVVLGQSLIVALQAIESDILDDRLRADLAHLRLKLATTVAVDDYYSRTTKIYITPLEGDDTLPSPVRDLTAGMHEVSYGDHHYRVLVEHFDDTRYTLQFDVTYIRKRERDFARIVWFSSLVVLLIASIVGFWLARRVSGPLNQLANQVVTLMEHPYGSLDLSNYNDDEIGFLAGQLQHYHEQLQNLLTREKEFAENVSHELRTPVTNISLAAEVLAVADNRSVKDQERIQRIQRATREMSELIDTFLVLARIEDPSIKTYSACEVLPIVKDVIEQQRVWLGEKPVEVVVDEQGKLYVPAPPSILNVLIANLVRNGFRYTERGTITILLEADKLTVTDTGVGVDAAIKTRLFERHVRGKSGDKDGAGLGLAIVQRVCERYGWTVSFDSAEGQGSRFTVRFSSSPSVASL